MNMSDYFGAAKGHGILATAGADGRVDAAIYSRPHVMDEHTVAFVMTDRLTHFNLQSNPHAAYLFMEEGDQYTGKRLFLTKVREDTDEESLGSVREEICPEPRDEQEFLVSFKVDQVLPLVGPKEGGV
jgi:hypothetical protein